MRLILKSGTFANRTVLHVPHPANMMNKPLKKMQELAKYSHWHVKRLIVSFFILLRKILKYASAGNVKLKHAVKSAAMRPRKVEKNGIDSAERKAYDFYEYLFALIEYDETHR